MKLLFYGRLADAIGPELELEAPAGSSVAEMRDRVATDYPHAENVLRGKRTRACVGDTLVPDDYRLASDETLEFLPPLSGG